VCADQFWQGEWGVGWAGQASKLRAVVHKLEVKFLTREPWRNSSLSIALLSKHGSHAYFGAGMAD
jgi:hypothetical protein